MFFPRECVVCGKRLRMEERHLCIFCESELPLTYYWQRLRNPMADRLNALIQKRIEDKFNVNPQPGGKPIPYAGAAALFFYHGESGYKKIPQRIKYHADFLEGRYYSGILGQFLGRSEQYKDIDTIIPVPLHWTRRWKRGYNQAEVIAGAIAKALGAELRKDILRRRRATRTQTKLAVEDKMRNVRGAFTLNRKFRNSGIRHILVVDDVFTTGATMASCFMALREHFGPETRISVATLGFVSPY